MPIKQKPEEKYPRLQQHLLLRQHFFLSVFGYSSNWDFWNEFVNAERAIEFSTLSDESLTQNAMPVWVKETEPFINTPQTIEQGLLMFFYW